MRKIKLLVATFFVAVNSWAQPSCVGVNLTTSGASTCTVPAGVTVLQYLVVGGNGGNAGTGTGGLGQKSPPP